MKIYKCKKCGEKIETEEISYFVCPNCGYEENLESEELGSIIDSVVEEVLTQNETEHKIKNKDNSKALEISFDNPLIIKNQEKCTNCGECKKVCEKIAGIKYDLNEIDKPICTLCGQCVVNCPSGALCFRSNYKEVKRIINLNDKIVVAIVDPSIYPYLFNMVTSANDKEEKLVGALKSIGFDYVFNGCFSADLKTLEEVTEFAERLKNKQLLPMITSSCPSWTNYVQIYHPELLKNVSTCKSPLQMHSSLVKEYFSKEKELDKSKIVTVSISTCTSVKEDSNDKLNIDYNITLNELTYLLNEENIDINNVESTSYDKLLSEGSGSSYLNCLVGGQTEGFVRTFNRIMKKNKLKLEEVEVLELRDISGIKETIIKVGDYPLRVAVVEGLVNLERIISSNKYKKYHYIEVMNCNSGCIGGCGRVFHSEQVNLNIDKIYKKDRNTVKRCAHDNREIKNVYKNFLTKPLSPKALETLHRGFKDESKLLKKSK